MTLKKQEPLEPKGFFCICPARRVSAQIHQGKKVDEEKKIKKERKRVKNKEKEKKGKKRRTNLEKRAQSPCGRFV